VECLNQFLAQLITLDTVSRMECFSNFFNKDYTTHLNHDFKRNSFILNSQIEVKELSDINNYKGGNEDLEISENDTDFEMESSVNKSCSHNSIDGR